MSLTRTAEARSKSAKQSIPFDGLSLWPGSFAREPRRCGKVTTDEGPGGRRSPSRRKPPPQRLEPGLPTDLEIRERLSLLAARRRQPERHSRASRSADAPHAPPRPRVRAAARARGTGHLSRVARARRVGWAGLCGGRGQRWSAPPPATGAGRTPWNWSPLGSIMGTAFVD